MISNLHINRQNAILVDLLMYTQILVVIFYDPMQISFPQCSHADWDCDSLVGWVVVELGNNHKKFTGQNIKLNDLIKKHSLQKKWQQ